MIKKFKEHVKELERLARWDKDEYKSLSKRDKKKYKRTYYGALGELLVLCGLFLGLAGQLLGLVAMLLQ